MTGVMCELSGGLLSSASKKLRVADGAIIRASVEGCAEEKVGAKFNDSFIYSKTSRMRRVEVAVESL